MASKPTVTLTLAGDEKRLSESFDRVGAASKSMADTVGGASREMANHAKRFDELAEKSDRVDTRAMGFRDTLTGLQDTLKGATDSSLSFQDRLLTLGFGVGDLASGFTNVLFPALSSMVTFMRGPLSAAMTFISSHPLLITLGLLAAAVIFLISQTDWFQNVATRVFNWVGHLAQDVFGATVGWIIDRWHDVIDFFDNLPNRIATGLSKLGDAIAGAFKWALNLAIDYVNFWVDRANDLIYGVNVINPFPDIPPIPHINRLHAGGVFHAPGGEGLALLRDGEHVSAPGQGGRVELMVSGTGALAELIQAMLTDGQIVGVFR